MSVSKLFNNDLPKKKRAAIALMIILVFSALYLFPPYLFSVIIYSENAWTQTIVSVAVSFSYKLGMFVLCAVFVKKALNMNVGLTRKNFFKGLFVYGGIMLVYSAFNFYFSFPFSYQGEAVDYGRAFKLLPIYLVQCVGIGIGEEGVWRVLGVNLFVWAFGKERKSGFFALLIPSVIFGLAHLNNIITPPVLINSTISQVFYATMIGFYFSVCYFKSNNILPPVILHALFDFAYYVCRGFYPKEVLTEVVKTDISPLSAVVNVITHVPILIYALALYFISFKKKTEDDENVSA